ncbi:MAG: peptidoglycan DD-metalloendopeptidase family protein [Myxococcota bacterium]
MAVDPASSLASYASSAADLGPAERPKNVREAAEQFEAMLIRQLIDHLPLPGMDENSELGTFTSMIGDALAEDLVRSGGLGLADEIERAMTERLGGTGDTPAKPTAMPVGHARVTSRFGLRNDPIDHTVRAHHGIDLAAPEGSTIQAVRAGKVSFAGSSGGYGNLVIVDHGDGLQTRYAHCRQITVAPGEDVAAGQAIATVGSTGRSTGPHVHFEVRDHGTPVDPSTLLDPAKAIANVIREDLQGEGSP